MNEQGILFKAEMVRAILDGRKTLTSRLSGLEELNAGYYRDRISENELKCHDGVWHFYERGCGSSALQVFTAKCRYGPAGRRLWVRETHWVDRREPDGCVIYAQDTQQHKYRKVGHVASGDPGITTEYLERHEFWHRKPAIHMPRWASRITLETVRVWPSRLQDMTEEMAKKEGCGQELHRRDFVRLGAVASYLNHYERLWDSINAKGTKDKPGHPWASNPWVWRIQFRIVANQEATDQRSCARNETT